MKKVILSLLVAVAGILNSSAQYTSIFNQFSNMLENAIFAGARYKGFVEASYLTGFSELKADFIGFSTTQGIQVKDWFFMGAGLGVDYVYSQTESGYSDLIGDKKTRTHGWMIPVFTDFRFNIGNRNNVSVFIDIKGGGSFLIGKNYLAIENGYISSSEYFLLKPSIGMRIPVGGEGKRAINIGATYQLLTCNYWWYNNSTSSTLNSIGGSISFEW